MYAQCGCLGDGELGGGGSLERALLIVSAKVLSWLTKDAAAFPARVSLGSNKKHDRLVNWANATNCIAL